MINSTNLNIKCENNIECAAADTNNNNNNHHCHHNQSGSYQENQQHHHCYQNRHQYGNPHRNNNNYPTPNLQYHQQQHYQQCQTNQDKFHACKQICKFHFDYIGEENFRNPLQVMFTFMLNQYVYVESALN